MWTFRRRTMKTGQQLAMEMKGLGVALLLTVAGKILVLVLEV